MLQWLNGNRNRRQAPNENYARELMELFTLGADRGAYTENDIREAAKGADRLAQRLTARHSAPTTSGSTRTATTTPSSRSSATPRSTWPRGTGTGMTPRLCIQHPLHASFFVEKLWSYFVPTAPSPGTRDALASIYTSNGYAIRPVLEAILMHPDFYLGPPMVKPPVVYIAGLLRSLGRGIDTYSWVWLCEQAGQQLFWPPNVSGWDDNRWLDTSRMRARWFAITYALEEAYFDRGTGPTTTRPRPQPPLSRSPSRRGTTRRCASSTTTSSLSFSNNAWTSVTATWQQSPARAMRRNALQQLIAISPDMQLS